MRGSNSVNLIPFDHKMSTLRCMANGGCRWMLLSRPVLIDWIGNIVVFAPFGAALALATWPDRRAPGLLWWGRTLLTGMLFSVAIELAQTLVPGRITDIDDVILNTLGMTLGMIAGYVVMRMATHQLFTLQTLRNEGNSHD